jgi:hypothetical protein
VDPGSNLGVKRGLPGIRNCGVCQCGRAPKVGGEGCERDLGEGHAITRVGCGSAQHGRATLPKKEIRRQFCALGGVQVKQRM